MSLSPILATPRASCLTSNTLLAWWVSHFHSATHFKISQVETCPKEDTYADIQRQALTIRLKIVDLGLGLIDPRPPDILKVQSG